MKENTQTSKTTKDVCVLVLNLNGKKFAEKNLQSLINQTYTDYQVIFIDAGSTDDSIQYVKTNFPQCDILELGENLGFTGGNNRGIEYAIEKYACRVIVTLNNDTWVEKDWLEKLIAPLDDEKVAMSTSLVFLYYPYLFIDFVSQEDAILTNIYLNKSEYRVLNYDIYEETSFAKFPMEIEKGKKYKLALPCTDIQDINKLVFKSETHAPITLNVGIINYFTDTNSVDLSKDEVIENTFEIIQNAGSSLNHKYLYFQDNRIYERVKPIDSTTHEYLPEITDHEVESGCGCAMAMKTKVIEELGWFDPTYYLYNEDNELSYRYTKAGYKIIIASKAIVHHYFWGSTDVVSPFKIYYGVRNRLWFIKKYFGKRKFLYFWFRTLARTLDYGQKFDKIYFTNYIKALIHAFK